MAKIRIREVDRTSIKTKNNSIAVSHRIRNAGSEIRRAGRKDNDTAEQSASEYSTTKVEDATKASVRKAKAIIGMSAKKDGNIIKERHISHSNIVANVEATSKAQSIMAIKAKKRFASRKNNVEIRRKAIATRQLKERIEDGVKATFFGAKALVATIASSGSIAVVVIVICCFLGSVVYFTNGEDFDSYKPVMVAIAEDEIGNEGGEKFWKWYGFKERVDWCAIFVSWCAEQCGYLDAEIVPKFSAVDDGAEWFKEKKQWASNDYLPKAGDIIFFDWESDNLLDHVGIVSKCKDGIVYTVEGNSEDICRAKQYPKDSKVIYGYGVTFGYNLEGEGVK